MSGNKHDDSRLNDNPDQAADSQQAPHPEADVIDGAHDDIAEQAPDNWAELLAETQEKVANYHDELLRAKAEAENIRRRSQEDVAKARKFGIESFAESLVPVKDSLEAALAQPEQDATAWKEGVEATLRQLVNAFERNAMKDVAPEPGERFDPHLHQAISTIPSSQPEGTVAQLLQTGYTIAERVLRPALVMVSAGPQDQDLKSQ